MSCLTHLALYGPFVVNKILKIGYKHEWKFLKEGLSRKINFS